MERRKFFRCAAVGGSLAVLGGGGYFLKQAYARSALKTKLSSIATPLLAERELKELNSIPRNGKEEIRDWFHGKCLDVASFVDELCSSAFQLKLKNCPDVDTRSNLILVSFFGNVVTESEILSRIELITEESGQELDNNWAESCKALGNAWGIYLKDYPAPFKFKEFIEKTENWIRLSIKEEIDLASTSTHYMTWADLPGSIGATALNLLPSTRIQISPLKGVEFTPLSIPTFLFLALRDFSQYFLDRFVDPKPNLQTTISDRLSLLGNRVGAEFEDALRKQVAQLHDWQEKAMSNAAESWINSSTGWV